MAEDIAVLAMDAADFKYLEAAKAQAGAHPDQWVLCLIRHSGKKAP